MDAREVVEKDMKECLSRALRYNILMNVRTSGNFYSNRKIITSKYTRFANLNDYLDNYHKKYEACEYLAAFNDGAFLQVNYEFDVKNKRKSYIEKMNLCYLPAINKDNNLDKEYIRVDYDSLNDNSFFHPVAHVHIGFDNDIRVPLDDVLLLSDFLKLILYLYYEAEFKKYFGENVKVTNTIQKSEYETLTKNKVLTKELEKFIQIKTKFE